MGFKLDVLIRYGFQNNVVSGLLVVVNIPNILINILLKNSVKEVKSLFSLEKLKTFKLKLHKAFTHSHYQCE